MSVLLKCGLWYAGIGLTLVAIVIVSLVNIMYPPSACPRSDPHCLQASRHEPTSTKGIAVGILLTLAAQAFQVETRNPTSLMVKAFDLRRRKCVVVKRARVHFCRFWCGPGFPKPLLVSEHIYLKAYTSQQSVRSMQVHAHVSSTEPSCVQAVRLVMEEQLLENLVLHHMEVRHFLSPSEI